MAQPDELKQYSETLSKEEIRALEFDRKYNRNRDDLIKIIKTIYPREVEFLDTEKKKAIEGLKRSDFIWHSLLKSFSTMSRYREWNGLDENSENYNKLKYENLLQIEENKRESYIAEVIKDANFGWIKRKSVFINNCLNKVIELGGLEKAKELLLSAKGRDAKIKLLTKFDGIGYIYAKYIMMDVYHEEFRDLIGVDSRVTKIIIKYHLEWHEYDKKEVGLLVIASELGIEAWELDRLLSKFNNEFLD